ncbi:MAG: DUF3106 domain-containing protein [Verrucomicrobiota bacterium]
MRFPCTFDNLLGSAGVLARRARRLAGHIFQDSYIALPLVHFPGFAFVTFLVTTAIIVQAQSTPSDLNPNLNPNLNLPPLPPPIAYKAVAPGVTLHQTSPVLYFRGILGMTPAERERALANKPADSKKILLAKVQEYQALPPDIREARLRQTQLRWELTSLINLAPAGRPAFLKEVAPEDRPLLEDYALWLTNSPAGKKALLDKLSPDRHQALTLALAQWDSVPETERQQRSAQFGQFCEEDQSRQQKTLSTFSESERRIMETALQHFAGLPAVQRRICIQSFQKFAAMDPAQRDEFLKNAARWETLTASERSLWRALVQKFRIMPPPPPDAHPLRYPPMPPGLILPPPLPPGMKPPAISTASFQPAARPPGRPAAATNTPR